MTKQTEALHKALKVLNCLNNDRVYETALVKGAINACEEALAQPSVAELNDEYLRDTHVEGLQPAQEPINLKCKSVQKRLATQWGYVKQYAQEPVAWIVGNHGHCTTKKDWAEKYSNHITPLYINPCELAHPAPSWQGLSITERVNVIKSVYEKFEGCGADILEVEIARAIEAKLKEKNNV